MIQLTQIRFALFKHHMISVYIWLVFVVNLRDSISIISGERSVHPVSGRDSSCTNRRSSCSVLIVFTKRMFIPLPSSMVSPLHLSHADTDEEEERGANDIERDSNTTRSKLLPRSYCFFILSVASSPKSKAEDADEEEEEEEEDNNNVDGEENRSCIPKHPRLPSIPSRTSAQCASYFSRCCCSRCCWRYYQRFSSSQKSHFPRPTMLFLFHRQSTQRQSCRRCCRSSSFFSAAREMRTKSMSSNTILWTQSPPAAS